MDNDWTLLGLPVQTRQLVDLARKEVAELAAEGELPDKEEMRPLATALLSHVEAFRYGQLRQKDWQKLEVALITAKTVPALMSFLRRCALWERLKWVLTEGEEAQQRFILYIEALITWQRVYWQEEGNDHV